MKNYENAIRDILTKTNYDAALIPHVNWNYNMADFTALDELYRKFKRSPRIHYIDEHNAPQQKYIISQCKVFVVLRTHAAIAALGSSIPALITGYKTKSRGIAQDIFQGKYDMTADVQSLKSEYDVPEKLFRILNEEQQIKQFYAERMPEYLSGLGKIKSLVCELQ